METLLDQDHDAVLLDEFTEWLTAAVNPPGSPPITELLAQCDSMSFEDLQAELDSRIAAFNALPVDEREAMTDRFIDVKPRTVDLPFIHVPPDPAEVMGAAAAAPLLETIEALRHYLGSEGKPLTEDGHLHLAEGRALVALLGTGDEMDPAIDGETVQTTPSVELRGLKSIVAIAKAAGAVRVHQRRLVAVKTWSKGSNVERATDVYRAILTVGPLTSRDDHYIPYFTEIQSLLDRGTVHWLALLLAPGAEVPLDLIVAWANQVLQGEFPVVVAGAEGVCRRAVSRIFEVMVAAGAVEWSGSKKVTTSVDRYLSGGTVKLTALGRHVLPDDLRDAGYTLRRVEDLADAPATALIEALLWAPDEQRPALANAWLSGSVQRIDLLVDTIASADDTALRFKAFAALELFDPQVVRPMVHRLLDGPAAGHAALWLLAHRVADQTAVEKFVDIGVVVDVLAGLLDYPEEMCALFGCVGESDDQLATLEEMWRHPVSDTRLVLDALGQHLPDRRLAKAARKAAVRHRSWMANRR